MIQARVLTETVRWTALAVLVSVVVRAWVLPQTGSLPVAPWLLLPLILCTGLPLLPWQRWLSTIRGVQAHAWCALGLNLLLADLAAWYTGVRGWWINPLFLSVFAPALVSLELRQPAPSPWGLNRAQWWALAGWGLMWCVLWWLTFDGHGAQHHEALWMLRLTWSTCVVSIFWVVLLKARLAGLSVDDARRAAMIALTFALVPNLVALNAARDWLLARSVHTDPVPVALGFLPVVLACCYLVWRKSRSAHLVPILAGVGLVWLHLVVRVIPATAPQQMVVLAALWVMAFRPQRWWLSALGWVATLGWFRLVPGVDGDQVILMGLSGTGVAVLTHWLLRGLAERRADQPIAPIVEHGGEPPLISPAAVRLAMLLGVGVGLVTAILGFSAIRDPAASQVQALLLLGLLLGLMSYTALHYWFERTARQHSLERKRIEELAEQQSHRRTKLILDNLLSYAALLDGEGRVLEINKAFVTHGGFGAGEIVGHHFHALSWWSQDAQLRELLTAALDAARHGQTRRHEVPVRQGGQATWLDLQIAPVLDENGVISGLLATAVDITEKRAATQATERAMEAALAADKAKSNFLATMSHELRTPLNALIGTAYLLRQSPLSEAQRADLGTIEASGKHVLTLINDILDFSKIEAGALGVDIHPFALVDVIRDLEQIFTPQARAKRITLEMQAPASLQRLRLLGDANRLRQCLLNLISNAIKFTPQGWVRLSVERSPSSQADPARPGADAGSGSAGAEPRQQLDFTVSDNGIGMTPEQMERLFQPFTQADVSTTRRYGGTGLGLSIVKRLTELMGGTLSVRSQHQQGTSVTLSIPFGLGADQASAAPRVVGERLSVLVVDDDADERQRLQQLAAAFRWEVDAVDVVDAMAALLADRTDAMPVCDCMLLGSQQTLTRLGEFLGDQPWPATILVPTSDAAVSAADPDRPRPDAVLHQPVEPALLFNAVNQVLVARGFDLQYLLLKTRIDSAQGQWLPGVRILVVDDSRLNLAVLERVLSLEGAHATLRESGEEALDTLRGEPLGFDLILMDLQMPGLDGCQTTELIRQEPRWRDLPILALTAGATDSEERRARDAGMDDFLLKPIDPVALVVALRMHIQRRLGHVLPVGLPLRRQPASVEVLALPVIAGLSTQDGLMRLGADAGLFIQQWDKTAREGVEVLASLHDAIAQADQARACAIAHKFRGQVASLGADALARGLAELETLGRAGQLRAEHLAALTTAFEAIRVPWLAWSAQHHARAAAAVAASAPEAEVAALTDDQVRLLVTDLEKRRFSALKHYRQQRAAWRQRLDAAAFSALDQAIEDTNFAAALAAIRPARTPD